MMSCDRVKSVIAAFCLLVIAAATGRADYSIDWYTIDGGGRVSSGGSYTVMGTIGQHDAGFHAGGAYELLGGYWVGGPLCVVEFEDFARLAEFWRDMGPDLAGDLDGNDKVDFADVGELAGYWLDLCPGDWPLK